MVETHPSRAFGVLMSLWSVVLGVGRWVLVFAVCLLTPSALRAEPPSTNSCQSSPGVEYRGCCATTSISKQSQHKLEVLVLVDASSSMAKRWGTVITEIRGFLEPFQQATISVATFPDLKFRDGIGADGKVRRWQEHSSHVCEQPLEDPTTGVLDPTIAPPPENTATSLPTPLGHALDAATTFASANHTNARKVVIVVSDGGNTCVQEKRGWSSTWKDDPRAIAAAQASLQRLLATDAKVIFFPLKDEKTGKSEPALDRLGQYALDAAAAKAKSSGGPQTQVVWQQQALTTAVLQDTLEEVACSVGVDVGADELRLGRVLIDGRSYGEVDERGVDGWKVSHGTAANTNALTLELKGAACRSFATGKTMQLVVLADAPAETQPCGWRDYPLPLDPSKDDKQPPPEGPPPAPGCEQHRLFFVQNGLPAKKPASEWTICNPSIVKSEVSPAGTRCVGAGRLIYRCVDNKSGGCIDGTRAELAVVCDGVNGDAGADAWQLMLSHEEPAPAGAPELEPVTTTPPGDDTVFRLRLAAPRIGGQGPDFGASLGVHPYRAWRAARKSGDLPFYNTDFGYGSGWLDALEVSAAILKAQPLFTQGTVKNNDMVSLGLSLDWLEIVEGGIAAPGSRLAAIATCVQEEVRTTEIFDQDSLRSIASRCATSFAHDAFASDFILGTQFIADSTKQLRDWSRLRASLVGKVSLLDNAVRATSQAGFELIPGDSETVGDGTGKSSAVFGGRLDIRIPYFCWLNAELSGHPQLGGSSFVEYGIRADFGLPLGLQVSPGYRSSVYDGQRDGSGYVLIGLAAGNESEILPATYFAYQRAREVLGGLVPLPAAPPLPVPQQ